MDGRTDGQMDGRMDRQINGWMDGRTDGCVITLNVEALCGCSFIQEAYIVLTSHQTEDDSLTVNSFM
jgi:hypothetical protein